MPLFKRKPFSLLDPPKDLEANEPVFQVRFTKEIFRDYQEYLKRLNLYRQRVWTCKVTGKMNLTYEEALVSEHRAYEKVQQFPKELAGPVLHMIQYSTLNLTDLVEKIWVKMQEDIFEGLELHARKEGSTTLPCRILKIITDGNTSKYEVGWLNREKKVTASSVLNSDDLIRKRPPLSRNTLRVFIKESTSQSSPWVVRQDLAEKYGLPTAPPKEMKSKLIFHNGFVRCAKQTKRAIQENTEGCENPQKSKRRKGVVENGTLTEMVPMEYPIEDTLLEHSPDDPVFTKRPPLVRDFKVPMESVGYLLSVWDFCSSFGRLLHLSPFPLTDFENAICHKGNAVLIMEVHAAIFYLLMGDEGGYFRNPNKKRKSKITLVNWTECLCDFLEKEDRAALFSHNLATIKRGHYGLLDTDEKLRILHELVEEALTTAAIREKLDEQIKLQRALRAANRDEAKRKKLEDSGKSGSAKAEMQATGSDKVQVKGKDKERSSEKKKPDEVQQGHLEREIEKLNIRTNPLGKERDHSRYWFFRREGRLFVESSDSKQWGYYSTKEELDALIGSLNPKGIRERALKRQLEKFYQRISTSLEKRTKEVNQKNLLEEAVLRRSTRVQAQPRENPVMSFLKYSNRWKET